MQFIMHSDFLIVVLALVCPTPSHQVGCFKDQSYSFSWNYTSAAARGSTVWYHNDIGIMSKTGDNPASVNNDTAFTGRIAEDPGSNAGMILNNAVVEDDGTFRVYVQLYGDTAFNDQDDFTVATDSDSMVFQYGEVWVNSIQIHVSGGTTYLGEPPFNLTYLLFVCVVPKISIKFDNFEIALCNAYTCSVDISTNGVVGIHIFIEGGNPGDVDYGKLIAGPLETTTEATIEITTEPHSPDVSIQCKDNMACIVPAIVVPLVVVAGISIVVVLVVKKKRLHD